ncbi:heterokaryon incompatibility protein-domain-containing protein [Cercophora samala]|uniref:Heterokaryon incompatibility protein-domain-containing protein n=1 Tax=Cercophora samala TaxID=330535 RepID=A0AA40CVI7_9PEZI|nr:heterokaryon incompatibility protein-domain-containing protein [Cercophora samala]
MPLFTPTRVIDTSVSPDTIVRIVTMQQAGLDYATLSHCWGSSHIFQLTSSNKATLESSGVLIEDLPTTFRQAIQVVRFLGIRYLWIDSLCIIQDSAVDWKTESSVMGKIYQHGRINIAASSSANSTGGLFFDRNPTLVKPFALYYHKDPHWYIFSRQVDVDLAREPLNSRGWVFQERLLSRRTIHFTKHEIVWHCLECEASSDDFICRLTEEDEYYRHDGFDDYSDIRPYIWLLTRRKEIDEEVMDKTRSKLHDCWPELVRHYSACQLTRDQDKVAAILGLINQLEGPMQDSCLAGLWRSYMPGNLLWINQRERDSGISPPNIDAQERAVQLIAPTWSWMSLNARANLRFMQWEKDMKRYMWETQSDSHGKNKDLCNIVGL